MSFFDVIEKLHKKPESTRRKIGLAIALGLTLIIVVLWIPTIDTRVETQENTVLQNTDLTPFHSVGEAFGTIFDDFSETLEEVDELVDVATTSTSTLPVESATTTEEVEGEDI